MTDNTEQDFTGLGNTGNYVPKRHLIMHHGHVLLPNTLGVKVYSLSTDFGSVSNLGNIRETAGDIVSAAFHNGVLAPHLGLGFAIVSDGIFNVTTWGGAYPSLMHPHVFSYGEGRRFSDLSIRELTPESVSDAGAYCVWEQGIVQEESRLWRSYLFSEKTPADKIRYLTNGFQGSVEEGVEITGS